MRKFVLTLLLLFATVGLVRSQTVTTGVVKAPIIIAQSGAVVSHTGDTNLTVLASVPIPANALGTNGMVRVSTLWRTTNGSGTAISLLVDFSAAATGGTDVMSHSNTATETFNDVRMIRNAGATGSQVWFPAGAASPYGTSASAPGTGGIDTTAVSYVNIQCQLTTGTDTVALDGYTVEVFVP